MTSEPELVDSCSVVGWLYEECPALFFPGKKRWKDCSISHGDRHDKRMIFGVLAHRGAQHKGHSRDQCMNVINVLQDWWRVRFNFNIELVALLFVDRVLVPEFEQYGEVLSIRIGGDS